MISSQEMEWVYSNPPDREITYNVSSAMLGIYSLTCLLIGLLQIISTYIRCLVVVVVDSGFSSSSSRFSV